MTEAPNLPDQVSTAAAITAMVHVLSHGHDGIDPIDHYRAALLDALSLDDRELAEAERAVMVALAAHPREQKALDKAISKLARLRTIRKHAARGTATK